MQIKITDGGKFAHPNPKFYRRPHLEVQTGDVIEVDDEQGNLIIKLGRAVHIVEDREVEIRAPKEVEIPAAPVIEEPPKKRRGRPPGKRKKL
jgi:DNA helicase TIP49 (TBP-interacting protein)